ncbi:uncharacterized protein F4812DRAFT_443551 [Daldinia caldariorum]|uniref:uncharacterized protein n=1 Tax=Daldinia caldariorum TaxID=326644 RepID=UPI002007918E|nr:uncharacterized protein F4812DRAFT_443551 [Daldinia caldariorum]KAI1464140.1 hypothetical protein F4812DRAFT_443551 [Daldinia caldariorum]
MLEPLFHLPILLPILLHRFTNSQTGRKRKRIPRNPVAQTRLLRQDPALPNNPRRTRDRVADPRRQSRVIRQEGREREHERGRAVAELHQAVGRRVGG